MTARDPSIAHIQHIVAKTFGLSAEALKSKRRHRDISRPRQVAMYLATRLTGRTNAEIARMFHRDRSTVEHAVATVADLVERDAIFAGLVQACADSAGDSESMAIFVSQLINEMRPALMHVARTDPFRLLAAFQSLSKGEMS